MFTVKQARRYAGYTQRNMAEKLGISRSSYINLEKHPDRITVGQAQAISEITGIAFDDLFFALDSTLSRVSNT